MKTKLILPLLLFLISCSIPQNVKDASKVNNESLKLFFQENTKFYSTIQEAIVLNLDAQIYALELNRDERISIAKEGTNEANQAIKNNQDLTTEEKIIEITVNERKLNERILNYNKDTEFEIQIQNNRKNKVKNSILILTNMQNALSNSNMKMNEYIQLKKASEYLLDEVKNTFPHITNKVTEFEAIIQEF